MTDRKSILDESLISDIEKSKPIKKDSTNKNIAQYLNDIKRFKLLDEEVTISLLKKASKGDKKAREKVIDANHPLVIKIATIFSYTRIELAVLIGYGDQGLIKAVDNFDFSYSSKFSTYAYSCILNSIRNNIKKNHNDFNVPYSTLQNFRKVEEAIKKLKEESKPITNENIIASLDIKLSNYDVLFLRMLPSIKSLEGYDDSLNPIDVIEDSTFDKPDEFADKVELNKAINKALESCLNEKERFAVIHRFGLNDENKMTFKQIGDALGFSKQRAQQVVNLATNKLRLGAPYLKEYLIKK